MSANLLLCVFLTSLLIGPCSSAARPASWFNISYTVDDVLLPAGLSVAADDSRLELRNTTITPIYLLIRRGLEPAAAASTVPVAVPSYNPSAKLTNTQAFLWNGKAQQWDITVAPNAVPGNIVVAISPLLFEATYLDHNRISRDRPRNVELPASQQTNLTLVYGSSIILLPITASYALNEQYEQAVHPPSCASNNWFFILNNLGWFILVGSISIVVGLMLVARRMMLLQ